VLASHHAQHAFGLVQPVRQRNAYPIVAPKAVGLAQQLDRSLCTALQRALMPAEASCSVSFDSRSAYAGRELAIAAARANNSRRR